MKKNPSTFLFIAAALLSASPLFAESAAPAMKINSTGGKSPHETTSAVIAGNRVTVTYGRPFAKGRKIWGGLVPYGKADRMGSDEATLLITQQSIAFGDTTVPAGAYTLYIVPSETGATKLAISTNIGKWGIPVDETHDLARIDLQKGSADQPVEQLTISVEKNGGGGALKISWENTQFTAAFVNKK